MLDRGGVKPQLAIVVMTDYFHCDWIDQPPLSGLVL